MKSDPGNNGWSLEVVRGRDVGKLYALARGAVVLGNARDGSALDLSDQEGASPRRMAARQAQLDCSPKGLSLRDLDSPGGTFVNRQRVLPGQTRALQPGDLIQLGGVQLKVVAGVPSKPPQSPPPSGKEGRGGDSPRGRGSPPQPNPPPQGTESKTTARKEAASPPKPGILPAPFAMASGATCRTWDDFLTVSAQRWAALRDELTSGRLAAFLARVGAGAMAPSADAPGTPDERLDAWLGSLPTTRPGRPELEVHPETLAVRAATGGGTTRQTVQVTNVGYRLLRSTVRVEPSASSWLRVPAEFTRGPFVTVDRTEVPIEVQIPEVLPGDPQIGGIVIEGNGGTKRVEVRVEWATASGAIPEGVPASLGGEGLAELIARQPLGARIAIWGTLALALRLMVALGGMLVAGAEGEPSPHLRGAAIVFAVAGAALAAALAARRGEPRDVPAAGFAGAVAGVLAAALMVAAGRTIEPILGRAPPVLVAVLLWAAIGAGLAVASSTLVPYRPRTEGPP
jgi:hypothetical protein